jgi:hypothetical protein
MTHHEEKQRASVGDELREGLRAGIGILSALKDAIEETVQDMADRGELSEDRAREAVRTTMARVQSAFDDARVRFDFVPRREFEALKAEVADMRSRLARHEAAHPGPAGAGGAARPGSGPQPEPGTGPGAGPEAGPGSEPPRPSPGGDIPVSES